MTDSSKPLSAAIKFDLMAQLRSLDAAQPTNQHPRSKTLLKTDDFRLVLISLASGGRLDRHHADGNLSLHVLRGVLRVGLPQEQFELHAGELVMLPASLPHDVEALENSAFLLTISWPPKAKLESLPHRAYA